MTRIYGHSETKPPHAPVPQQEQSMLPVERQDREAERPSDETSLGDSVLNKEERSKETTPLQDFLKGLKPDA